MKKASAVYLFILLITKQSEENVLSESLMSIPGMTLGSMLIRYFAPSGYFSLCFMGKKKECKHMKQAINKFSV